LQETCVKLLQQRKEIPLNCDRIVQIKNTIWTKLDNNAWIYFAPIDESVTVSCTNHDPEDVGLTGVGKLALDTGCKGYTSFTFLQTKVQVKPKGIKGEDLLSRIPMDIYCLEEIGLHSNLSITTIKLDFKHVVSHVETLNMLATRYRNYKRK
jgi:hypothetical protein